MGPHLEQVKVKSLKVLFACRKAVGKSWGYSPTVARWCYIALVRPVLDYCCVVWAHTLTYNASRMKRIERIHRIACLMCCRAFSSVPSPVLEVLSGVLPILVHLKGRAISASARLKVASLWDDSYLPFSPGQFTSHAYYVDRWRSSIPVYAFPLDLITPILVLDLSLIHI